MDCLYDFHVKYIVSIFTSQTWCAKPRVSASAAKVDHVGLPKFFCKKIHPRQTLGGNLELFG